MTPEQADPVLQTIIQVATKVGDSSDGRAEIGITLLVSGMLVSGRIVSSREFAMGNMLTDQMLEAEELLNKQKPLSPEELEARKTEMPQFIHLADARFTVPGQAPIPTTAGVFWRGRLSEVSGFHIGILQSAP